MSSVLCHAKANGKYLNNYNENKDLSYVIYLDKNNLYGLAMSLNLSVDGFERDEISKFTLKTTFKNLMKILILGIFLEDLENPQKWGTSHKELPILSEKMTVVK